MNKKKILSFFLVLILLLSSLSVVQASDLNLYYKNIDKLGNIKIIITGEKNRQASISIEDSKQSKKYIDNIKLDSTGVGETEILKLSTDEEYIVKVKQDGLESKININLSNIDSDIDDNNTGKPEKPDIEDNENPPSSEDKKEYVSIYIKGYKGKILSLNNIKIKKNESVLRLTKRILDENNIKYVDKSGYISSIDGQEEFDKGKDSGWMYSVNGKFPNKGAGSVRLKDGDRIEWLYTYDLGEDIGAGSSFSRKDDSFNNDIDKIIKELEEKNIKEKDVYSLLKDLKKEIDHIENNKIIKQSNKITDALVEVSKEFNSERVSEEILNCNVKLLEKISKYETKDYKDIHILTGKIIANSLSTINNINSTKNKEEFYRRIIDISERIKKEKNINKKESKNLYIYIGEDSENKISKEFLLEAEKNNIDNIIILSDKINFYLNKNNIKKIKEDFKFKIEKNNEKIIIKVLNEDIVGFLEPIKIEIKSDNKYKNIILDNGKEIINLGGLYFEDEGLVKAYTKDLGIFKLEENKINFKDITNYNWAKEAINILASKNIIKGIGENKFNPSDNISRAEFSAIMSRMLNLSKTSVKQIFKDVDKNSWYFKDVNALYEAGYINGRNKEQFDPNGKITREEISKIIGKILVDYGYKKQDHKTLEIFLDNREISEWAKDEMSLLVKNDVLRGDQSKLNPRNNATRAEAATLIYRVYNLLLK